MASTASRTTKKASSTARSAARKTVRTAKKTASTAKRATSTVKKTARKSATAAKTRATSTTRSTTRKSTRKPDALQLLIDDHHTVEALFKKFEGLGDRAHKARGEVVARVIEELSIHAVIEEQAFYPAVRSQAKAIEDDVLEALEEHHIVKWVLSELERMSPTDERYVAKFTVLMENVRHHVEEEESDMFPKVRKALSKEQLVNIGVALAKAKESAPHRPHPRSPDTPPGNLIAGAVSAPLDAAMAAGQDAVNSVRNFASRATNAVTNR